MFAIIKSELLKQKRSQSRKMLLWAPLICMLLGMMFMGFKYVQQSSFNWWYMTFLPFVLVYHSGAALHSEKKYNYHGLFSIIADRKRLWMGKIAEGILYLLAGNFVFGLFNVLFGLQAGLKISVGSVFLAGLVIVTTMIWQIPLFMFLCRKTNLFITVFAGVALNIIFGALFAPSRYWWLPFSITAKLMCPMVKMFPNGLLIPQNDPMLSTASIWPGMMISTLLFLVTSIVTTKLFEHQEVA